MHIAVTGATGFIGRYIVNLLTRKGHTCRCWHRASSDCGGFDHEDKITWLEGRLNDPATTEALIEGADAVVHSALERSGAGFTGSEGDLIDFAERNILGSLRLMQAAKNAGAGRFIFISTCAVHDVILQDRKLDEAHPLWPMSHYGAHKAAIEKFVHSFGLRDRWPICALRPTGVYGIARPVERSKWYDLVQRVKRDENIESRAGGKEVHAADVAKAVDVLLNVDTEKITGESFNCYDMYISDEMVARVVKEFTGSSSKISDLNHGPKNQIDTTKIRELGMTFGGEVLLRQTVQAMVK